MTRYYAVSVDEDGRLLIAPGAPHPSYTSAICEHTQLALMGYPRYNAKVLVDLSSLPVDSEEGFKGVLHDDPVLSAIFKWGREVGRRDAEKW